MKTTKIKWPLFLSVLAVAVFCMGYQTGIKQNELQAYQKICDATTPENVVTACDNYLNKYHDGTYEQEVTLVKINNSDAPLPLIQQYLAKFPDGKFKDILSRTMELLGQEMPKASTMIGVCSQCGGRGIVLEYNGFRDIKNKTCPNCGGTGKICVPNPDIINPDMPSWEISTMKCPNHDDKADGWTFVYRGTTRSYTNETRCSRCGAPYSEHRPQKSMTH